MPPTTEDPASPAQAAALAAFDSSRFGFHRERAGWVKEFAGLGPVAFAGLAWPTPAARRSRLNPGVACATLGSSQLSSPAGAGSPWQRGS